MAHMRKSEDRGPSVKTAEGAARLGLYVGGLKLRSLAGMGRKGSAYRQQPASLRFLQTPNLNDLPQKSLRIPSLKSFVSAHMAVLSITPTVRATAAIAGSVCNSSNPDVILVHSALPPNLLTGTCRYLVRN